MSKVTGFKILLAIASSIIYLGVFSLITPQASASNEINVQLKEPQKIMSSTRSLSSVNIDSVEPCLGSLLENVNLLTLLTVKNSTLEPVTTYLKTNIQTNLQSSKKIVSIADGLIALSATNR